MGKPATGGEDGEEYQAKRSARVPSDQVSADNDVWRERLAVVETVPPEKKLFQKASEAPVQHPLRIRSYFQSSSSGERVWDEPPSGASRIEYSSDLEKEMAEHQMAECTVIAVPGLESSLDSSSEQESSKTKKKKKGFLRSLKHELKRATTPSTVLGTGKIAYKNNSTLRANNHDPQDDPQLQMAIAMSMNTSAATDNDPLGPKEEDDDDIAMAKAMSMSVADSSLSATTQETTEEQMLRKALEESRLEEAKIPPTLGAARLPTGSQKALFELEDALLEEDSVEVPFKPRLDDYDDDGGGKLYASFVGLPNNR